MSQYYSQMLNQEEQLLKRLAKQMQTWNQVWARSATC
jgi:hypothetical protein